MGTLAKRHNQLIALILLATSAYIGWWLYTEPGTTLPILTEEVALSIEFDENDTKMKIVRVELTDVILSEHIRNIQFVETSTESKLLLFGHGGDEGIFNFKPAYTLAIPTQLLPGIKEQYHAAYGDELSIQADNNQE